MLYVLDDTPRYTDGELLAGRPGERPLEYLMGTLVPMGLSLDGYRITFGPCWPVRCEIHTGHWYKNHGYGTTTDTTIYDQLYNEEAGRTISLPQRPSTRYGPWGWSIAAREGLPGTRVTNAAQATAGILRDASDDAQRDTGWFGVELAREGIPVFAGLKWQNGWRVTHPIPAGITNACMWETGGNEVDEYSGKFLLYEGANAFDGEGVDPALGTITNVNYVRGSATLSWSAGLARVQCNGHKVVDAGELVYLTSGTAGYVGLWEVASVESTSVFYVTMPSNPGGTGTGTLYVRNQMPLFFGIKAACDFFDACGEGPGFAYLAPHQTHDNVNGYANTREKQYTNSIDQDDAMYFNGVAGAVAPGATDPPNATQKTIWKAVVEQLASVDDSLKILAEKLMALRPNGDWAIIVTSDQGMQNGEAAIYGNGTIKTAVWEGSARPFCYVIGPRWFDPGTFTRPTAPADLGATILDIFGLTDNHWHLTRDGISVTRLVAMTPSDARYDRAVPLWGDWKTLTGEGYVDADNVKWLRPTDDSTLVRSYDTTFPTPYESVEVVVNDPAKTTFNNRYVALSDARFNTTTETNPANDGSI